MTLLADSVEVTPTGMEHAGGLTGEFRVDFADIAKVSISDHPIDLVRGVKVGVGLPETRIGTWHHDGIKDYFCVHRDGPAVVLELIAGHTYGMVVVTVDDPDQLVARIQTAMSARPDAAD